MAHKTKKKKKKLPSILNHLFQVDIEGNDLGSFFILVVCHFTVPQIISLRGLWRYRKKQKAKQKQNKQTNKQKTANNSAFLSAKILNVSLQIITQGAFLLVIRQNGKSQNRCYKKTKHAKFSKKTNIFYLMIRTRTCAFQGGKKCSFIGKFGVLFSCNTHFKIGPFAFLLSNWSF